MFQKIEKTVGVSDFRTDLPAYLKRAKEKPLVITTARGGEPYVLLSAAAYNKLVEEREDDIDASELTRLVKENKHKSKIAWR